MIRRIRRIQRSSSSRLLRALRHLQTLPRRIPPRSRRHSSKYLGRSRPRHYKNRSQGYERHTARTRLRPITTLTEMGVAVMWNTWITGQTTIWDLPIPGSPTLLDGETKGPKTSSVVTLVGNSTKGFQTLRLLASLMRDLGDCKKRSVPRTRTLLPNGFITLAG